MAAPDPHAWLEQYGHRLEEMKARGEQVQAVLQRATGRAVSPDGAVTVVVGTGGRAEEIQLSPRIRDISHTALGPAIVDTIRRAQTDLGRAVEESVRPILGEGETMQFLREQITEATRPVTGSAEPRRRPADEDDGPPETFLRS